VLCGLDMTDRPAAKRIQSKLHSLRHPLAPLPLALTKLESVLSGMNRGVLARMHVWIREGQGQILPEGGGEHATNDTSADERPRLLSAFAEYESAAAWAFQVPQGAAKWTCGLLRVVAPPLAGETRWHAFKAKPATVYPQLFSLALRDGDEAAT